MSFRQALILKSGEKNVEYDRQWKKCYWFLYVTHQHTYVSNNVFLGNTLIFCLSHYADIRIAC